MSKAISRRVLSEFKRAIDGGEMRLEHDPAPYYAVIEKAFPIGINRINWFSGAPHLILSRQKSAEPEKSGKEMRYFITRAFEHFALTPPSCDVLWLGDMIDFGLRMKFPILFRECVQLFSYPQHSYVIPSDASWCLNYTFEDDLFFGPGHIGKRRKRGRAGQR